MSTERLEEFLVCFAGAVCGGVVALIIVKIGDFV